jgi:hypothetical protein
LDSSELEAIIRGEELPPISVNALNAIKAMAYSTRTDKITNEQENSETNNGQPS